MSRCLRIAPTDNVAVALEPVAAGDPRGGGGGFRYHPGGHSPGAQARTDRHPAGADVIKYGYPIGRARTEIQPGQWVHTHNLATRLDGAGAPQAQVRGGAPAPLRPRSFQGYRRADGRVGIRNELWIVPTVGCVNGVARSMARRVEDYARGRVDGVHVWFHPYGCSQMGEDQEHTRAILCGLIRHPNAGAVLVLGLGCENSSIAVLQERLGRWDSQRVAFLECQAVEDELAEGERLLRELADRAAADRREPVGADELVVGTEMRRLRWPFRHHGQSPGGPGDRPGDRHGRLRPAGGGAGDVRGGGGAVPALRRRGGGPGPARAGGGVQGLLHPPRAGVYENPSPGNKAGGITTLEEKSLGCVQKGGNTPIVDVLHYGETVRRRGLTVLQTPGNDLVSATGLAAAGAHLILFTTGRGTPFGAPVPTLKLATNTALASRKAGWIDYDAGGLAQGDAWEPHIQALLQLVLDTALRRPHPC